MHPLKDKKASTAALEKAAEGLAKVKHAEHEPRPAPKTKADFAARVRKLWIGGERRKALAMAEEHKLKAEDRPEGMAAYADAIR